MAGALARAPPYSPFYAGCMAPTSKKKLAASLKGHLGVCGRIKSRCFAKKKPKSARRGNGRLSASGKRMLATAEGKVEKLQARLLRSGTLRGESLREHTPVPDVQATDWCRMVHGNWWDEGFSFRRLDVTGPGSPLTFLSSLINEASHFQEKGAEFFPTDRRLAFVVRLLRSVDGEAVPGRGLDCLLDTLTLIAARLAGEDCRLDDLREPHLARPVKPVPGWNGFDGFSLASIGFLWNALEPFSDSYLVRLLSYLVGVPALIDLLRGFPVNGPVAQVEESMPAPPAPPALLPALPDLPAEPYQPVFSSLPDLPAISAQDDHDDVSAGYAQTASVSARPHPDSPVSPRFGSFSSALHSSDYRTPPRGGGQPDDPGAVDSARVEVQSDLDVLRAQVEVAGAAPGQQAAAEVERFEAALVDVDVVEQTPARAPKDDSYFVLLGCDACDYRYVHAASRSMSAPRAHAHSPARYSFHSLKGCCRCDGSAMVDPLPPPARAP